MTASSLDTAKIVRLRLDLGNNTSLMQQLVDSFRADIITLGQAADLPLPERADVVHLVTGSAAMLAPATVIGRLNRLENSLRDGAPQQEQFNAALSDLMATAEALDCWLEQAPPDGEPIVRDT